jgi:hypothetical protein
MKKFISHLAFILLVAGCQESVFQSLKKTDNLFVYEGLPHPLRENPSFEKEKRRDDVMQILGHWFYDKKVKAVGSTRDQLMNLLFNESGFSLLSQMCHQRIAAPFIPTLQLGGIMVQRKFF